MEGYVREIKSDKLCQRGEKWQVMPETILRMFTEPENYYLTTLCFYHAIMFRHATTD